jgi:hypothetical protein
MYSSKLIKFLPSQEATMAHEPLHQKTRLLQVHAIAAARSMHLQQHKIGSSLVFISTERITGSMHLKD